MLLSCLYFNHKLQRNGFITHALTCLKTLCFYICLPLYLSLEPSNILNSVSCLRAIVLIYIHLDILIKPDAINLSFTKLVAIDAFKYISLYFCILQCLYYINQVLESFKLIDH